MFKNNLNDSSSFSFSNKFKVAVIGDSNSGKTSSIRRISNYSNYAVNSSYIPTIGVDYNITSFRDKNAYYKKYKFPLHNVQLSPSQVSQLFFFT